MICKDCGQDKPIEDFVKRYDGSNKVKPFCIKCGTSRRKKYFTEQQIQNNLNNLVIKKSKNIELIKRYKSFCGCKVCGDKTYQILDLHHTNPEEKEYNPSSMSGLSLKIVRQELRKCVVLCANHHRLVHAGLIIL